MKEISLKENTYNQALKLMETGQLEEAERVARLLVERDPKQFQYLNLYGVLLKRMGRYEEAISHLIKAGQIKPSNPAPWINLGNIHHILENGPESIACFTKAVKLNPRDGENYRLLARSHLINGNPEKALVNLKKAVVFNPRDPRIRLDISWAYFESKAFPEALETVDKAIELFPQDAALRRCKGMILRAQGKLEEAAGIYQALLRENPRDIETLIRLGNLYYTSLDDREKANLCYAQALSLEPDSEYAMAQYIDCLRNSRYGSEAAHLEKAYELSCRLVEKTATPLKHAHILQTVFLRMADYDRLALLGDHAALTSYWGRTFNIHALHNQLGRVETLEDRLQLIQAHRAWGQKVEEIATRETPISNIPSPPGGGRGKGEGGQALLPWRGLGGDKIRIGIMSSDLRNHPVTYFAQPILELYDKSRFEIYCYSFYPGAPDAVQARLTQIVDRFRVIIGRSDREIAQQMAADQLDILFELGGATHLNRLEVMAYKPAPVQVSWLGYPHSCGLSTIDYILVDPYIHPPEPQLLIEQPFEMLESWVAFNFDGNTLPIEPGLPEDRAGYVTFGTMNNPYKYTPQCFAAWAEILKRVENARFLFIRPESGCESFRRNVSSVFARHGIPPERLEFRAVRGNNMPHYNAMDISLDPFPHVGGTSTCEALWMGVPVITLVGPAFFERLSYSNLNNAGLDDLCAATPEEYIRLAVSLAQDKPRRQTLRETLRPQLREHPLGQPERFVRHFENQVVAVLKNIKNLKNRPS